LRNKQKEQNVCNISASFYVIIEETNISFLWEVRQMKNKLIVVLLSIALAGSLALSGSLMYVNVHQNKKVNKYIADQLERQAKEEEKLNNYQEDGYKVGEQYEIRSTKDISDAYKSGDESKLSDADKKTLKLAKDVLKSVIKDGMTNYQKEQAVYEWMYKNIGHGASTTITMPTATGSDFTPGGVLVSHQAVCVGYATTFRMFMNMLGMECHIVHNEYHSWDLLKLDDGKWYHTDIYTDVSGHTEYQNFNMTDAQCTTGHDWDTAALPAANGVKYSYAVQNNKKIKDIFAVPGKIKKLLDKDKPASVFYSFDHKLSDQDLKVADVLVAQMGNAMSSTGLDRFSISASWYNTETEGEYILGVFLGKYEDESKNSLDPKMTKKINEIVAKAFGLDPSVLGTGMPGEGDVEDNKPNG
jgi:hypothetical protein